MSCSFSLSLCFIFVSSAFPKKNIRKRVKETEKKKKTNTRLVFFALFLCFCFDGLPKNKIRNELKKRNNNNNKIHIHGWFSSLSLFLFRRSTKKATSHGKTEREDLLQLRVHPRVSDHRCQHSLHTWMFYVIFAVFRRRH